MWKTSHKLLFPFLCPFLIFVLHIYPIKDIFLCSLAILLSLSRFTAKNARMNWIKTCKIKIRIFCSLGFITGMWNNLQIEGQDHLWFSCLSGTTQKDFWSAEVLSAKMTWAGTPNFQWSILFFQASWSEPAWSWAHNQSCWFMWHLYESHCIMHSSRKDKGPERFVSLQDAK